MLGILAVTMSIVLPLVGFGLLVARVPNQVVDLAVRGLAVRSASAAEPTMVFEGETITLEEADAEAAADATNRHPCTPETDEVGVPIAVTEALRFVPVCEQDVGPIGDLAVAATYDAERGLMPFDVVEAVPPTVATYR